MQTEAQFRAEQYATYFRMTLWYAAAVFGSDWVSIELQNCKLPHSFTSNIHIAFYAIHMDVFMAHATSRFDLWLFVVKVITLVLYNAYKLLTRLNRVTIIVATFTMIHLTYVYFKMNDMEAKYQCQIDINSHLCPNGTRNSILFGNLELPKPE